MRGASKGYSNETAGIYAEFVMRQSAAKLGFVDSLDSLDSFTAECFAIIGSEIAKMTEESIAKAKRKGGNGRG